jgi:hypothetical protein
MGSDPANAIPQWAIAIKERHQLWGRTDEPLGGVIVLLQDAAVGLQEASMTMFEEQAATRDMVQIVKDAMTKVDDALALASICSSQPKAGSVERLEDGTYLRKPISSPPI